MLMTLICLDVSKDARVLIDTFYSASRNSFVTMASKGLNFDLVGCKMRTHNTESHMAVRRF